MANWLYWHHGNVGMVIEGSVCVCVVVITARAHLNHEIPKDKMQKANRLAIWLWYCLIGSNDDALDSMHAFIS